MSPPLVRIVRGVPTDEELAAVTVALLGLLAGAGAARHRPGGTRAGASGWARPAGYHAPGAWTSR